MWRGWVLEMWSVVWMRVCVWGVVVSIVVVVHYNSYMRMRWVCIVWLVYMNMLMCMYKCVISNGV